MTEDNTAQPIAPDGEGDPNGAPAEPPEKDWKAEYEKLLKHSRSWEDKAKRLKEKADRLDELEASTKTDAEKLADAQSRAEAAEAELAKYKADAERAGIIAEVAEAEGVDASLLSMMRGDTRDEVEAAARQLKAELSKVPLYPPVTDKGAAGQKGGMTLDEIRAIKDPKKRLEARAEYNARHRK